MVGNAHGLFTESGGASGFSFPPAVNPPVTTTADYLLRTGFISIPMASGPSLSFAFHTPGTARRNLGRALGLFPPIGRRLARRWDGIFP